MNRFFSFLFILLSTFICPSLWAKVTAEIQPKSGNLDTLYTLIFTIDSKDDNTLPDFSPLEKDFDIESTGSNTQISIINGQMSAEKKWVLRLSAKRQGNLVIPALSFNQEKSKPLTLTVNKDTISSKNASTKSTFLENSVDNKKPYVQSEITYTVKLFFSKRLSGASFKEPEAQNALILQLGEPKSYQTKLNNTPYFVLEQTYAIFPEKSGPLQISPPVFNGIIERENISRIDHILMDVQKPIRLRGKTIDLNVLPIPTSFKAKNWLPAKAITINQEWENLENIKVGSPITRTITLKAKGVTSAQLPNLSFPSTDKLSAYADKAQTKNTVSDNQVLGTKTIKVVYIANQEGQIIIPQISLPWWNTLKDKKEMTTLEGKTLMIAKDFKSNKNTKAHQGEKKDLTKKLNQKTSLTPAILIPWIIVALLSLSWLIYFLRKKVLASHRNKKKDASHPVNQSEKLLKAHLKKACFDNDATTTLNALITYLSFVYPNVDFNNLNDICAFFKDEALKTELDKLSNHLYAKNKTTWQGDLLWKLLSKIKLKKQEKKVSLSSKNQLPPLNP